MNKSPIQVLKRLYKFVNDARSCLPLLYMASVLIAMVIVYDSDEVDGIPTPTSIPSTPFQLQRMIVLPEDMEWPSSAYRLYDEYPDTVDKHLDFLVITLAPSTNWLGTRSSRHGASQYIWAYSAEDALDHFMFSKERSNSAGNWASTNFMPRTENVLVECGGNVRLPNSQEFAYRCHIFIQSGMYYTHAVMTVDENNVTIQDWERYVNLVQDKFLEHANEPIQ